LGIQRLNLAAIAGLIAAAGLLALFARKALLATLVFGGLRIGEALALRWRDVDLAAGRLQVTRAKTDAGVRRVDLRPALRDELAAHKAHQARGGRSVKLSDLVFGTEAGNAQNPSNVRNRVLTPALERANERRAKDEKHPLPEGLSPHSLRKAFISVLFALGEDTPYIMGQVGHRDPKVTLGIYAEVMRRGDTERESQRALVEASDWAQMGTNRSESHIVGVQNTPAETEETAL